MLFDEFQIRDLPECLDYLREFWIGQVDTRTRAPVSPVGLQAPLRSILDEPLPQSPQPLRAILDSIDKLVVPNAVKTAHPLFLAYVTPPSLDIGALADAITGILNQNVMFAELSPAGTAVEEKAVRWLGELLGLGSGSGGVVVSGGSTANLYGLAVARRIILGGGVVGEGNYADLRRQRIYCSQHIHRSVHKAAMLLGIGTENVVSVPADDKHQVLLSEMERLIERDLNEPHHTYLPTTIVGAAGTRLCCAFDNLAGLHEIARRYNLWLHVDAAYGGFLKLAKPCPPQLESLPLADSITIDPHKLLFVPFDSGCFLVRNRQHLLDTFGTEGEYLEKSHPPGTDFADLGIELGRSMKALKVWLALKYIGVKRYGEEFTRLVSLARYLEELVRRDSNLELLAPVAGTVVCFRWKKTLQYAKSALDAINKVIRTRLLREGIAYVNEVTINERTGIRVCITNFRTEQDHVDTLVEAVSRFGCELSS